MPRAASALQQPTKTADSDGSERSAESDKQLNERISREARDKRMTPTGLEPARQYSISSDSGTCAAPGAALGPDFGPIDPDLASVIDAWPSLPESNREAILAIVRSASDAN